MANNFEQALPDQDWDDILGISDEFSDEEKLVQKTAYEYSSKELLEILSIINPKISIEIE